MAEKINRLVANSNFYIALFNPEDSLHNKATQYSEVIQKKGLKVFISDLIFLEVVTVLSIRTNRKIAFEAGTYLMKNPNFTYIDPYLHQKTWEIFKKIDRKNMSFVDCSIIAVMQHLGITTLLTFDTTDFKSLQKTFKFKLFPL